MFRKLIEQLFGSPVDFKQLKQNGAVIIDVRIPQEFKSGHVKGAKNIPLQNLESQIKKIDKNKVVITCCKSGMRSANAMNILKKYGYEVYNGRGWQNLDQKLNS